MKITRIALLLLMSMAFAQSSNAQASDKLFKSRGYSLQWSKIPIESSSFTGGIIEDRLNYVGIGYSFNLRYTLAQLSDNASVGLSAGLTAALDCSYGSESFRYSEAYGSVYAPIHVDYNIGAGSTYDSDKDSGFGIGIGLTPSYLPIVGGRDLTKLRLSPSVKLSIRSYKAGSNSLREYFIRLDKLPNNIETAPINSDDSLPFTLTIGRSKIIGY